MDWNVQGGKPFGGAGARAVCLSQHSAKVSDVSLERSHRCECDDDSAAMLISEEDTLRRR